MSNDITKRKSIKRTSIFSSAGEAPQKTFKAIFDKARAAESVPPVRVSSKKALELWDKLKKHIVILKASFKSVLEKPWIFQTSRQSISK